MRDEKIWLARDGRRIAYVAGDRGWDVIEVGLADGAVHLVVGFGGSNHSPAWAPSGTHFLFSAQGAIVDQDASGAGFSNVWLRTGCIRAGRRTGNASYSYPEGS